VFSTLGISRLFPTIPSGVAVQEQTTLCAVFLSVASSSAPVPIVRELKRAKQQFVINYTRSLGGYKTQQFLQDVYTIFVFDKVVNQPQQHARVVSSFRHLN
jgi:hypothetical protein